MKDDDFQPRPLLWLALVVFATVVAALRMPRFHSLVPTPLAYALAVVAGVIAAAVDARTLKRQIAFSIPYMLMTLGAIWLVQYFDVHGHVYLRNKDIYGGAILGCLPGFVLYLLIRFNLK